MGKYTLKRLLYMIGVFFIVSIIMFALFNSIPGDRALTQVQALRGKVSDEQFQKLYELQRDKLGLDDIIPVRYVKWMGNILRGNLGFSTFFKKPVIEILGTPIKNTVFINLFATILALGITIPLGIRCAVKRGSTLDKAVQVGTIVGYSVPVYIIAPIFIFIFCIVLKIFPVSGMNSPNFSGNAFEFFIDRMYYLAVPLIVMTVSSLGGMTRYTRAAMIDVLKQDYIRTARAKGLKEKRVINSHAFRNALLSIVTLIIGWFMSIFSGSIVIEQIFQINGIGQLYYKGLLNQDYDVALAITMLYCAITLLTNLITDLSYGLIDPRVRVNK